MKRGRRLKDKTGSEADGGGGGGYFGAGGVGGTLGISIPMCTKRCPDEAY